MSIYTIKEPGVICRIMHPADQKQSLMASYASITAPAIVKAEIFIDDELFDLVYAGNGGSHSWWFNQFLPAIGLQPGETLQVQVDGPCALRIDWEDGTHNWRSRKTEPVM